MDGLMGNPGSGGGQGGGNEDQFAASFKQFCQQPENRATVQEHQRKEIRRAERVGHRVEACAFRDKVLESDYEAQQNIAPFMENKFLRRIIQTFCNDEQGDFGKWAKNPRVIEMLQRAKELVDNGHVEEDELEHRMIKYLQQPENEGHEKFDARVNRKINVEQKDLVGALNEQCTLRHEGNLLYVKKNFEEALLKYGQALSIMNLVKASDQRMGQYEINQNKTLCLMNIASACVGMKDYGAAIKNLDEAELAWPDQVKNFKLYTRRARAHVYRGNFAEAKRDSETAISIDSKHEEIREVEWMIDTYRQKYAREEKERARTMFKFPKVLMSDQKPKWPQTYGW
jgi:tetratricopeptide (TPR) repeat protein